MPPINFNQVMLSHWIVFIDDSFIQSWKMRINSSIKSLVRLHGGAGWQFGVWTCVRLSICLSVLSVWILLVWVLTLSLVYIGIISNYCAQMFTIMRRLVMHKTVLLVQRSRSNAKQWSQTEWPCPQHNFITS
jgi:hypothetical protein